MKVFSNKKKSDIKDSIGYDSIYMKSPLKANLSSRNQTGHYLWVGLGMGNDCKVANGKFGGHENVLKN